MTTQRYLIWEQLQKYGPCRTKRLAEHMSTTRNNLGPALRAMRDRGYVTSKADVNAKRVSSNQPHIWTATEKVPDGDRRVKREIPLTDIPFGQGNREMNVMATMPLVKL